MSDHPALPTAETIRSLAESAASACGVDLDARAGEHEGLSPITGTVVSALAWSSPEEVARAVERAHGAYLSFRQVPAPVRGALVKRWGDLLTEHKADLATLVSIEAGKVTSEALGEVQEMIDICEFAVGLSRQLYGRTMPSERPGHRLMETWHPLGVVGVISAFNFPVAVWSWNTALALVCGDAVIWKPSEQTPLSSLAAGALLDRAIAEAADLNPALSSVLLGDRAVGEAMIDHHLVALVSATGSTRMGREVGPRVAQRFGKALLELGGNNAAIVTPSADLALTARGIVFAAAGTAGQRCTTMRRVIVHESIAGEVVDRVSAAYRRLPIGDPMTDGTLVGPLIGRPAYEGYVQAIADARAAGGEVVVGGDRVDLGPEDAFYVQPTVIRMPHQSSVVQRETFAPILYVLEYASLDEAIALNNAVPQGLSSSIFTQDQAEAEIFMSAVGSDCGIVNVNIGTSGAEIGGAFGGEKETGGGRESGSDAWRAYMRRATNTINYSGELPLAQGVTFEV